MILAWIKPYKKQTEERNNALLEAYTSLNEKNRKKVDRSTGVLIGLYFSVAIICLVASVLLLAYDFISGTYYSIAFIIDLAFFALSVYATYTSSSWFAAKPYQRILLRMELVIKLIDQQQFEEVSTNIQVDGKQSADNLTKTSVIDNGAEAIVDAKTDVKPAETDKVADSTPTDDKKD